MDEYMDVVDENDQVIGKEKRSVIHSSDMWHRGIHIILRDEKGNFLLQLRSPTKDKFPSRFDCLSEHVGLNEEYIDAAKRGLEEELGITAELKPIAHFKANYGPGDNMINTLFECTIDKNDKLVVDENEISEITFLGKEKVEAMLNDSEKKITPWFEEILKYYFGLPNKLTIISDYRV